MTWGAKVTRPADRPSAATRHDGKRIIGHRARVAFEHLPESDRDPNNFVRCSSDIPRRLRSGSARKVPNPADDVAGRGDAGKRSRRGHGDARNAGNARHDGRARGGRGHDDVRPTRRSRWLRDDGPWSVSGRRCRRRMPLLRGDDEAARLRRSGVILRNISGVVVRG